MVEHGQGQLLDKGLPDGRTARRWRSQTVISTIAKHWQGLKRGQPNYITKSWTYDETATAEIYDT